MILDAARDEEILVTARKARKNFEEITAKLVINIDNTEPKVRTQAAANGVALNLRFLTHPRRRLDLIDKVNRQIMDVVAREDKVDFAYNTLRMITAQQR